MFDEQARTTRSGIPVGQGRKAQPALTRVRGFWRSFQRNERGTVAILFALTTFVVVALVGGAVDYGRAVTARDQLQNAVDAAALAAARVWQTENNMALAEEKGMTYFQHNKPRAMESSVSGFQADTGRNALIMEAEGYVPAPFMSAATSVFTPDAPFQYYTVYARSEALLAVGGNSETNLEISMMLDVTGSMSGQKIVDLKAAAKDLIDIVVWDDQSQYTSKVALVPFAQAVHLGATALVNQVRGSLKSGSCTSSGSPCTSYTSGSPSSSQWTWGAPAGYYRYNRASGGTNTWRASSYCVTERIGADRYTDAAPNAATRRVGPLYASSSSSESSRCSMVDTADMEVNSIQPLTNDKTMLKRRIDKLDVGGSTAGQIGTAWSWYMLSPSWSYLWPTASQPVAYHTERTQKIAILMTDGEYNTAYSNGVLSNNSTVSNNDNQISTNATNGISDTQADEMCTAMKQGTGITVYTIGFALGGNNTAINTLRNCASDPSKFYEAEDGDALRQAFRDIALQIAKLRLSQ